MGEEIISAALIFINESIVQNHLSGTATEFLKYSGQKIIINEVRNWAVSKKFSRFHLGGGVGSKKDSLYDFKRGFSKLSLPFRVVRIILDQSLYNNLTEKRIRYEKSQGYKSHWS